jgi:hypothetical protein
MTRAGGWGAPRAGRGSSLCPSPNFTEVFVKCVDKGESINPGASLAEHFKELAALDPPHLSDSGFREFVKAVFSGDKIRIVETLCGK